MVELKYREHCCCLAGKVIRTSSVVMLYCSVFLMFTLTEYCLYKQWFQMEKAKQRILIIDDHAIVIAGVKSILVDLFVGCEIHEALNGAEANRLIRDNRYDMVILDLNLPDISGELVLKNLLRIDPKVKVLVLSMNFEDIYAAHVLRLGAKGYVSKQSGFDQLRLALQKVSNDMRYVSESVIEKLLFHEQAHNIRMEMPLNTFDSLSTREHEIIRLICEGHGTKEIANMLGLKLNTISTFKRQILDKLAANNVVELIEMYRLINTQSL